MSVSVNCWYCSEDSLVPAHCRDSWECPKCDQFNSFTAEGDVAPSAAAAGAQPRSVRYNAAVQAAAAAAPRWQLCARCNQQQQLKARQLAEFRPVVDQRWEAELDEYRRHLERVYLPCAHCQAVVASALREADDRVRPAWLAWLRQRQPAVGESEARTGLVAAAAGSRLAPLWAGVRCAVWGVGTGVRGAAARLGSGFGVCLALLLPAGLLLLLLLLCSSCLLNLRRELVPEQYQPVLLDADDVFSENKATLVLFCFTLWVFVTKPGMSLNTFIGLLLWSNVCAVEMSVGYYITDCTAALLQAVPVLGLLYLSVKVKSDRLTRTARVRTGRSPLLSSSTPRAASNGSAGGHSTPLSNGHTPAAGPTSPAPNGLPSPIPARPPSTSPQVDYDYNLPRLSLGSPRKQGGSSGVFALRTYQPAAGGALFSGRPGPLLSPARLRSELHHSAWIAGGYWQRGQPAPMSPASPAAAPLVSRSSSQSSGFVDACGPAAPAGSVLGEDEPRGWAGSQCDARSCAGDTWQHAPSCIGSQRSEWRSCAGDWRGQAGDWRGRATSEAGRRGHPTAATLDSSSMLSDRSLVSQRTATSSLTEAAAVSHRSLLIALVLGFSMAFNVFALLLMVYRDRL